MNWCLLERASDTGSSANLFVSAIKDSDIILTYWTTAVHSSLVVVFFTKQGKNALLW